MKHQFLSPDCQSELAAWGATAGPVTDDGEVGILNADGVWLLDVPVDIDVKLLESILRFGRKQETAGIAAGHKALQANLRDLLNAAPLEP